MYASSSRTFNDEVGGVEHKSRNKRWGVVLASAVWESADSVLLQSSRKVRVPPAHRAVWAWSASRTGNT